MLSSVIFSIVTAKSAKDNMKKFTSPGLQNMAGSLSFLVIGVITLLAMTADVSRAQTSFASAEAISGDFGTVTNDNTGVTADVGAPNIAGFAPNAPLWYQWTAPQDGVVSLDTIGSVDFGSFQALDTVLGVYTGTSLTGLSQVAANDNLFPINGTFTSTDFLNRQTPSLAQLVVSGNADYLQFIGGGPGELAVNYFTPPFYGPSGLHFNAKAGQTYYFAVDSKATSSILSFLPSLGTGFVALNWAYQSSGVLRFASEDVDTYSQMLLYQTAETESEPPVGTSNAGN